MSLLNTFAILFETDAKEAADDIENLSNKLDETEESSIGATSGLDDVTGAADEGSFSIGGLTKSLGGLALAYISFSAISQGVMENALGIDKIGKFSQVLGEDIVQIDAWGEAVARNGGSADGFRGSVESLNTSLADIKISGGGEIVNTLSMLGVRATTAGGEVKSAFDVLPQLADSFQKMSASQSFSFGRKLGLDQGTILLLQQGRSAVDELVERQKMLGNVTEDGYKKAALFNDQWDDTKRMFNSLWTTGNSTILPILTDVLKLLEKGMVWIRENQDLVEGFFIGVAGVITAVYLPAISSVASATLIAIAPFLAIGAAIAAVGVAIALVYDDFKTWESGGDSLIGSMLGPFKEFKDTMLQYFKEISDAWDNVIDKITTPGKKLGDFLFDVFGDDGKQSTEKATNHAQRMIFSYSTNPLNAGAGSYNARTSNINNNVTVGGTTVNASGMTTQQATNVVNSSLTNNIVGAMGQMDNGVDR